MRCFPVVLLFWALSVTALPPLWQENQSPEEDYLKRIKVQENLPSSENNGQYPGNAQSLDSEVSQEYLERIQRNEPPAQNPNVILRRVTPQYPGIVFRRVTPQNPGHILRLDPEVLQEYLERIQRNKPPQNPGIPRYLDPNAFKEYQGCINCKTTTIAAQKPNMILRRVTPLNPNIILRLDPEVLQKYLERIQRNKSPSKKQIQKPGLPRSLDLEILQDYLDCIKIQKNVAAPENNGLLDPKDYLKCTKFQKSMPRPKGDSAYNKGQYPSPGRRLDPGVLQFNKFNRGFIKLQNTVQLPAGPYGK
ncbi:uncharacterized protein LOC120929039 isoform X1 [Rana temporaria]|uniref:uncharacterized protein LOC120929039 isoform X1 n=1 Tax=Rana temporaria TaxID=8407 RepID=UPI001AAD804D|nr:uncharacterized protein LOC120929039 isoform X1 [Rana temporaria]